MYAMKKILLAVEALRVFGQQAKANGSKTTDNYKVLVEGVTTDFFPPKALQNQKSYLCQVLYNPC